MFLVRGPHWTGEEFRTTEAAERETGNEGPGRGRKRRVSASVMRLQYRTGTAMQEEKYRSGFFIHSLTIGARLTRLALAMPPRYYAPHEAERLP